MRVLQTPLLLLLLLAGCAPPPLKHLRAIISNNETPAESSPPSLKREPQPDAIPYAPRSELAAAVRVLEALVELENLRRAYPERHEAIFNEAILLHEYGNYLNLENREMALKVSIDLFHLYIRKAEGDPEARDAVRIAKERLESIEPIIYCNFKETEADRKHREQEEKQRAAEAEAMAGE